MPNITTAHLTEYEPQPGNGPSSGTITQTATNKFTVFLQSTGAVITDKSVHKHLFYDLKIK